MRDRPIWNRYKSAMKGHVYDYVVCTAAQQNPADETSSCSAARCPLTRVKDIADLSGTGQTTAWRCVHPDCRLRKRGAIMTHVLTAERRVSDVTDRRRVPGRGGGRADDYRATELDLRVSCAGCGRAWASLSSFTDQRGQHVAHYLCPRCGHIESRCPPFQPRMVNPGRRGAAPHTAERNLSMRRRLARSPS
jgi:hypothetical protein